MLHASRQEKVQTGLSAVHELARLLCGAALLLPVQMPTAVAAVEPLALKNSTWEFLNSSASNVEVSCKGDLYGVWLANKTIPSQASASASFDARWGDGLGFPEPGIGFTCQISWMDGPQLPVLLRSLGWGDHVSFAISERSVVVTQASTWQAAVVKTTRFDLGS